MSETQFTVDYFIAKFEAIPEELWCTGDYVKGAQCCALGHCGERRGISNPLHKESTALCRLLDWDVAEINDGILEEYPQGTPRARILAALNEIKAKEGK